MTKVLKLDKKQVLDLYNKGLSSYEISENIGNGCYPNKIRRFLKTITNVRGRSESQKHALKSGRRKHPTKGKKFSDETKLKMSEAISKGWSKMDNKKYKKLVKERKEASAQELPQLPGVERVEAHNASQRLTLASGISAQEVLRSLVTQGVTVEQFEIAVPTLDEIFIRVVQPESGE